MRDVVIVSAKRTAVGKFGGGLKDVSPAKLGSAVIEDALKVAKLGVDEVEEVIMGNVLGAGHGQNIARQAAIGANIPVGVPSYCVNKVCGSGLKSALLGTQSIMLGDADIVVAGGIENMSQAPYLSMKSRWGVRMGNEELMDYMVHDGLWDIFGNVHMGITAENVAAKYNITREEQDEFSVASQNKAEAAIKGGRFKDEITPVGVPQRKGDPVVVDTDEFPRFGATKEALAKLRPAFKKDGTVTAGNSSGINDGSAAVVLMSADKAKEKGITPIATIKSYASVGVPPEIMGMGPVGASKKALERAGMKIDELDLLELNEAFAAQSIGVIKELGISGMSDKINVNGGAVALGHPIGASGARILVTLLAEMTKRDSKKGLASLCIGGGQGVAMVVTR